MSKKFASTKFKSYIFKFVFFKIVGLHQQRYKYYKHTLKKIDKILLIFHVILLSSFIKLYAVNIVNISHTGNFMFYLF